MSNVIMPDKDFYNAVEKPGALKHVLYGDSVAEDSVIEIMLDGKKLRVTFKSLWEWMNRQKDIERDKVRDKEYLFPQNDRLLIQNYDLETDTIRFVKPRYLCRHFYEGNLYRNYLTNEFFFDVTKSHSLVDIDVQKRQFKKVTPINAQFVPIVNAELFKVLPKYAVFYGLETKYDYYGTVRASKTNKQMLFNVTPHKLCKKMEIPYSGFVYDLEVPANHTFIINYVVVHNTDSLFIEIPQKPDDVIEKIKLVNQTSKDVNDLIENYTKNYLLPRCGFSSERNETHFKEELVIDSMIFLNIKKNYSYCQICSEARVDPETNKLVSGKILERPKIVRRSSMGIKSDMIYLTRQILEYLINTALDNNIKNEEKYHLAMTELGKFHNEFIQSLKNMDIEKIGMPSKYNKKVNMVNSMKLYNCVVEKTFEPGSTGFLVYIKNSLPQKLKNLDPTLPEPNKLTAISIPPKNNPELITSKFKEFGISWDVDKQWNLIMSKVVNRTLDELRKLKG